MDSFLRIEQPDFTVIRNPVPLPVLALTFPPWTSLAKPLTVTLEGWGEKVKMYIVS